MAFNMPCAVTAIGDKGGNVMRASIFIVGPLVGDSSRSRREDSLFGECE